MATAPCRCVEVACKGSDMLDECADNGEGWLAVDWLDRDSDHASVHHFSDGGHGGRDRGHYLLATVARVYGRNVVPRCRWQWYAQVAAALAACGDGGARAWTAATVDASGVMGGAAVAVACSDSGWQPVAAAAALAVFGDDGERPLRAQAADSRRCRWQRPPRFVATASAATASVCGQRLCTRVAGNRRRVAALLPVWCDGGGGVVLGRQAAVTVGRGSSGGGVRRR